MMCDTWDLKGIKQSMNCSREVAIIALQTTMSQNIVQHIIYHTRDNTNLFYIKHSHSFAFSANKKPFVIWRNLLYQNYYLQICMYFIITFFVKNMFLSSS